MSQRPQSVAERRWLSQQEAADYLGVTDRTIRNYVATGALTGRRLPGSRLIRIDRYELDAALVAIPAVGQRSGVMRPQDAA
jgi:excisionase family DNA binding protein